METGMSAPREIDEALVDREELARPIRSASSRTREETGRTAVDLEAGLDHGL